MIGARGKVKIWKAISLYAEGDVGGFDANSGSAFEVAPPGTDDRENSRWIAQDWSYQIQGGLEFQITPVVLDCRLGWRYLKYDYVSGGFTNKTDVEWPLRPRRSELLIIGERLSG